MRAEDADRLAALDEQRLVRRELEQRADERAQGVVAPRRPPRSAVNDQLLGLLGNLGVEVVEQHAERGLGLPRARVEVGSSGRPDRRQVAAQGLHGGVTYGRDGQCLLAVAA